MAPSLYITNGQPTIGFSISLLLFGMNLKQSSEYFSNYPKDRLSFKAIVGMLTALNLGHTIALFYTIYYWNVDLWGGDYSDLDIPTSFGCATLIGGIIIAMVQIFYAYRIFSVMKTGIVTTCISLVIVVGALVQLSMATFYSVHEFISDSLNDLRGILWSAYLGFWDAAAVDILISIVLIYNLQKAKGLVAATNKNLNHVIRLTLQTNLLTAIMAIINGIFFLKYVIGWPFALYFVLVKLYVMSALSSLNARQSHIRTSKSGLFPHREPVLIQQVQQAQQLPPKQRSNDSRRPSSARSPFKVFSMRSDRSSTYHKESL